jgi:hypothetical protein
MGVTSASYRFRIKTGEFVRDQPKSRNICGTRAMFKNRDSVTSQAELDGGLKADQVKWLKELE